MAPTEDERIIRRILVALDASSHNLAALQAAADLAAALGVELAGLFVEDERLLRSAELSFARAVHYPSATERPLERSSIEIELRVQAREARRAMEAAAGRVQVRCSFHTVRGDVAPELLAAARKADLLLLGKTGHVLSRQTRLGSTERTVAMGVAGPVLLVEQDSRIGGSVMVACEAAQRDDRALAVAAHLARALGAPLTVLLAADTSDEFRQLEAWTAERLRSHHLPARCRRVQGAGLPDLLRAVQEEGPGILVLEADRLASEGEPLTRLIEEIELPVLLVR
jgi:nucleotide-binding universal stress UspA family protein